MEEIKVVVKRGAQNERAEFNTYDVPYHEGMSVLDAIVWIRTHIDSSLAFRYSCINANACKECVMRIDGKTGYACTTPLSEGEMLIEPLPNKRLIRDLVTDTLPPDERLDIGAVQRSRD